ncbi:tRNA (N6-isopentenyl adenosine(37)-C2)-methylthiotransferase MiaB [Vallitalea sp.]|jgi:tRNA-2-methylthio-N6-dimethylallyladenosine synthase|uniref:tRNA (N6-isopentenyl adenosine(37)-C2)-methylthiotransferase MiaB n=1 Tax=Vallitalea sp. TaxID=1882829 RepID=UPI0025F1122E|nr:tRNA (N6-isopentenyl adenosine(37)-C2)-methylthiotransferase MiaB [Vallitalea sp.]MCT4688324.1 tRNA (N6-isopentenyl adenosine(37)-C2)-methylthiotransferase MiaB [Vallitalea sp.]
MNKNQDISHEESLRQKRIIDKLSKQIEGKGLKYYVSTFGCQMNAHDSEKLKGILEQIGYVPAEKEKDADFVIYNTCCVRENAELKVYGRLGSLKNNKKHKPGMLIALCGCMMQQDTVISEIKRAYKHVDILFGTHNLYKLAELIQTRLDTGRMVIDIWENYKEIVEDLPSIRKFKFKSSVNVMFGCNNFCTYCIVPYVRGRERSRKPGDIINEITDLVDDGVKEITLLGQNVNSYGKNLDKPLTFAKLIQEIEKIEGLERIRFMTSHPKDLSDELIEVIKTSKKLCDHIHLPFQSGSTDVLKKMNRRYTKDSYLELVNKIKEARPDVALTTDIIVGFPGETEEDFLDTLDVVKQVEFDNAFTFLYSVRTGTPAATMENQVPENVAKDRFNRLLEVLNEIVYKKSREKVGNTYDVLIEQTNRQDDNLVSGRLGSNHLVHLKGNKDLIGEIVPVKIIESKGYYLIGEQVN